MKAINSQSVVPIDKQACGLCGSGTNRKVADNRWVQISSILQGSEVVQCLRCGFIFTQGAPVGHQLEQLNRDLSVSFDTPLSRAEQKVELLLDELRAFGLKRAIDIGGGVGHFAACLNARGLQAWTYDPYAKAPSEDKLCELSRQGPEPHLFALHHVLEHVVEPVLFLSEVVNSIQFSDDDVFAIEVPVLDLELISQPDPSPFLAPFHLSHFSIQTLHDAIRLAGLNPFRSFAMPGYNGFMVLSSRSAGNCSPFRPFERQVGPLQAQIDMLDVYLKARSVAVRRLRAEFRESLGRVESLAFWGMGLGFDAFTSSTGFDFESYSGSVFLVERDEDRRKRARARFESSRCHIETVSPEKFLRTRLHAPTLVVSTSYAGKNDIRRAAFLHPDSEMLHSFRGASEDSLHYVY